MKIGDVVTIRSHHEVWTDPGNKVSLKKGDVGVIINIPSKLGDIVEIIANGETLRTWMALIEVINEPS